MLTPLSAGLGPASARCPRYQRRRIRSFIQRGFLQAGFTLGKRFDNPATFPGNLGRVLAGAELQLSEEEVKELIQEEILENCILREKWQICGTNWTTHRFDAAANWIEGESVQAFG